MFGCSASQSRSRSRCFSNARLISSRARRACSPLEHRFLRDEHLVEVALHEDDPVALVRRQVEEKLGDHLEGLAPCLGQPGRVILDLLDLLELVIASRVVGIGGADVVGDSLQPAPGQHLHHERRAGSGQT